MTTEAYVICCNDSVEFVVIGPEGRALEKLEELAKQHYERTKHNYNSKEIPISYKDYRDRCYWHIHTVSAETWEQAT